MAEANQLEKIAQAAPQAPQQKAEEQKKPVGALESVVNETLHFGKSLFNLGLAGAIPFATASAVPPAARDIGILAGAQAAADATVDFKKGKKYTLADGRLIGDLPRSTAVGTGLSVPVFYLYEWLNKIPLDSIWGYFGRAAAFGGLAYPAYIGLYQLLDYPIKNGTFKGLGKYLKENYWPSLKRAWKYVFPFGLANVFFSPPYLQIPIGALLSYIVALFGAPKKAEVPEEQKRDKTPYLVAAPKVAGRLAYEAVNKLVYNPLKALYEIGSNLYKPAPAKPPATAPATQPA